MAHVLVAIINSHKPLSYPADHGFNRRHSEPGKALKNSIVHHRGHRLTGILDDVHGEVHKPRVTVTVPLTAGVMRMPHQVKANAEVKILRSGPDRIKVWLTKAFAFNRSGRHENRPSSQLC